MGSHALIKTWLYVNVYVYGLVTSIIHVGFVTVIDVTTVIWGKLNAPVYSVWLVIGAVIKKCQPWHNFSVSDTAADTTTEEALKYFGNIVTCVFTGCCPSEWFGAYPIRYTHSYVVCCYVLVLSVVLGGLMWFILSYSPWCNRISLN